MVLKIITIALILMPLSLSSGYADEFVVGDMRNVDPSEDPITSTSGTCVPSHDWARLDCYFTTFGLMQPKPDWKHYEEFVQEVNKDPEKQIQEGKKSLCSDKNVMQPDSNVLKYNALAKTAFDSMKAFCENPTRDSLLAFFRTSTETDARKCHCVVTDWRSTLLRQGDRWVENSGPSGLCGIIKVFILVPHDLKKMKDPIGPVLWTLHEKTVITHSADDKLCAKGLFKIHEGTTTVSWDAPRRSIDCGEIEFTSGLEGMSNPQK